MDDKPTRKLEFGVTPTDVMASMSGIDFVRAMFAGQLPEPPIMQTVEPFDCTAEPGVVAIHISNRHLRLGPVLGNIVKELKIAGVKQYDNDEGPPGKNSSDWVVIAKNAGVLAKLRDPETPDEKQKWEVLKGNAKQRTWTDDFEAR